MFTDWLLLRRCALELLDALRGARCVGAGTLSDGRIALAFERARERRTLIASCFGAPPTLALDGALPFEEPPGFTRSLREQLTGSTLLNVESRRGDRLIRLRLGARSRFGVVREAIVLFELVPRFGNALLLKEERVLAALRTFDHGANRERAVLEGQLYEAPPLSERLLVPKLLVDEYGELATGIVAKIGSAMELREPLFVYREQSRRLIQAHLVELPSLGAPIVERERSLLAIFAEIQSRPSRQPGKDRSTSRRARLLARIERRRTADQRDVAQIGARLAEIEERDALRATGEAIFATLHALPIDRQSAGKAEAAALFARYRALGVRAERLAPAHARLCARIENAEALAWEARRVEEHLLVEVESAFQELFGSVRQRAPTRRASSKRNAPLCIPLSAEARILVGRSPEQNAELTFRVATPEDWWFHSKGVPGAHVVLQHQAESSDPEDAERAIASAADCAALFSGGNAGLKVPVEYTRRKHVRKQRDGAPGLVFYTNARACIGVPDRARALLESLGLTQAVPRTRSN